MNVSSTEELYGDQYTTVYFLLVQKIAIVKVHNAFVPMSNYREALRQIAGFAEQRQINKLIIDAQNLVAYHRPSVEWSFTDWKRQAFNHGLSVYCYVLPRNEEYQKKLKNEIHRIKNANPDLGFLKQIRISFCDSLDEAVME
ncbi:hypothetical protein [Xanthocytophaga agilis]|uniref:Uncharacterized protein n=1 Tax=Xanthocytophaga agilis TaxID=3048010 RepID=A0AAE3R1B6_9BACT|nr:hypothetical protein [Xanthocytophaga agilis]MDJ1499073.1 hypothetical protein [Xanthocytophaga agilis]